MASAQVEFEEVGGASEKGEEASMVGRLTGGLLGISSSSLGADRFRTLDVVGEGGEKKEGEGYFY